MAKDITPCEGCRDNFYNGRKNVNGNECWSLKTAKLVTRFKLHWWTAPTIPGAFREVKTYDCHHEPGQFAFYKKLPSFAKDAHRLEKTP